MKPITLLIALLALGWLAYLAWEARCAAKARASLAHVVHVNGTRGKSTVSRLIEAGLRAGGLRVFCKTTGTDPMTIDGKSRSTAGARPTSRSRSPFCAGPRPRTPRCWWWSAWRCTRNTSTPPSTAF